ncbi:GNAT family N-acetyltransferase [Geomonas sp. RF6]|uniref:GNAT family N-acetyltransferase n=1 Tax=Geomonas sp. RF6 TaxID=2897342 RepID=UPI001E51A379|nr:GNAT family N-acetyltransferase [Geomonas sp. RF6]UFS69130.1 GNAT family N-acetyltransferase [Geomonas sp. RF6]
MGGATIDIVDDALGLDRLQPEWDVLHAALKDDATFFMSHPWYRCWWAHFGGGGALQVLVVRKSGETVGIFPLMRHRAFLHGVPVRALSFLENGNSLHNEPLVLPECREKVLGEVLGYLYRRRDMWDVLQLKNIPEESENCASLLRLLLEDRRKFQSRPSFASPYINVSGTWETFLSSRSARARKTLRNIENTICRHGRHEIVQVTTWEAYRDVRAEIEDVARSSWTDRVGDSLAQPGNAAFFADLACVAAARQALSLWILKLEGRTVAFEFHLRSGATDHALRASYHEEYAHLSPGAFLEMQILKKFFEVPAGIRRIDFGGSFDRYKRRWSDSARAHVSLTAFHGGIGSTMAALHELGTVALLRTVRDKVRLMPEILGGART